MLQISRKWKSVEDCTFYVGTTDQVPGYVNTLEFIINHIKQIFKRGKYIAKTLFTTEK